MPIFTVGATRGRRQCLGATLKEATASQHPRHLSQRLHCWLLAWSRYARDQTVCMVLICFLLDIFKINILYFMESCLFSWGIKVISLNSTVKAGGRERKESGILIHNFIVKDYYYYIACSENWKFWDVHLFNLINLCTESFRTCPRVLVLDKLNDIFFIGCWAREERLLSVLEELVDNAQRNRIKLF